ncbi:histidine kinase N-terminal domain-containing protein [Streptococcus danieliae]|uniref:histidine kinase n=1 Tax=Streptococcus danieliae TaxID=747656 RepID=A0A7Z0M4K7_9STRE|nr:histidine kinase N-terminal domain-containing protein [Streptococcus danieliae]MBF0698491.1 histidine kinase N-terminal domain-containing protein [Streptococcus danieliae]NYS95668.1 histidine kinase N-terminal domain-containing protein [Streptococcus danieliae]
MSYREKIEQLCREQTDLDPEAICYLLDKAAEMELGTSHRQEDVFIDVQTIYQTNEAMVIYHRKPLEGPSLYTHEVVGEVANLENEPGVIRTLQTGQASIGLSALSQEGLVIYQTVYPITWQGQTIGALIVEAVNRQFSSPILFQNRSLFLDSTVSNLAQDFQLFDCLSDGVFIFNQGGHLVYANPAGQCIYREQLAYRDSIYGMHYDNLVLDSVSFMDFLSQKNVSVTSVDYGHYSFQIKRQFLADRACYLMEYRDNTEQALLQRKNQEQRMALREANHRVKNNLQTLVSLLRLQAYQSESSEVQSALEEGVQRILSVVSIHDLLAADGGGSAGLEFLLKRVVESVQRSFWGSESVQVDYLLESRISLESSRATALALVVNELVQNSFKHAFKKTDQAKRIRLQLSEKDGIIRLLVADNGNGYKIQGDGSHHRLGLTLVQRFVQGKLSGKLKSRSGPRGTETTITFKY